MHRFPILLMRKKRKKYGIALQIYFRSFFSVLIILIIFFPNTIVSLKLNFYHSPVGISKNVYGIQEMIPLSLEAAQINYFQIIPQIGYKIKNILKPDSTQIFSFCMHIMSVALNYLNYFGGMTVRSLGRLIRTSGVS